MKALADDFALLREEMGLGGVVVGLAAAVSMVAWLCDGISWQEAPLLPALALFGLFLGAALFFGFGMFIIHIVITSQLMRRIDRPSRKVGDDVAFWMGVALVVLWVIGA